MKKITFVVLVLCVGLLLSCSHTGDNVAPKTQNSLGLVIPRTSSELSSNLILLKDGRTADPVSGIVNFDSIPPGEKLSLSFTTGQTHNGVLDIHVIKFASAQDSVFVPGVPVTDSTSFTGTFSGIAYSIASDSSFHNTGVTSIHFTSPNKYQCDGVEGGYPLAGSGTFVVSNGTITFTDANTDSNTVLNGSFDYCLNSSGLYMWSVRTEIFYGNGNEILKGFSLRRN